MESRNQMLNRLKKQYEDNGFGAKHKQYVKDHKEELEEHYEKVISLCEWWEKIKFTKRGHNIIPRLDKDNKK